MSHTDPLGGGHFSFGEKLTSAVADDINQNAFNSVDKTSAGDTVSGILTFDSTGGCTFQSGAAVEFDVGSTLDVSCDAVFDGDCDAQVQGNWTCITGSTWSFDSGSTLSLKGTVTCTGTCAATWQSGATCTFNSGTTLTVGGTFSYGNATCSGATGLTFSNASGGVVLATRTLSRVLTSPSASKIGSSGWLPSAAWEMRQQTVSSPGSALWEINLPDGVTLTEVHARLSGASGHVGLPSTMPVLTVYKMTNAGAVSTLGTATDSSASVPAYESMHAIDITGLSEVLDRQTKRYIVNLAGEENSNAITGLFVNQVWVKYTTTSYALE